MPETALIVVDVQAGIVNERTYQKDAFIAAVQVLLGAARKKGAPVIFIRHSDGEGTRFAPGNADWQIAEEVAPFADEPIIDKRCNSAFYRTDLQDRLEKLGAKTLVLAGMMCEYCLDATVKSAFERDYRVVLAPEANTTRVDNCGIPGGTLHHFYNHTIWNNRFATVLPIGEVCRDYLS
jgi:Amidases related to nicotinamidase